MTKLFISHLVGLLVCLSMSAYGKSTEKTPKMAKRQVIVLVNKMVDGKKTWVSSHPTIRSGVPTEIVAVNTLDEPHGFEIPGVVKPTVLVGLATKTFELKPIDKTKLNIINVRCQMHPAHVGDKISVK